MKGLILLAPHFEDIEAIVTIDLLRRAHIQIDLVSVVDDILLETQSHIYLQADYFVTEIEYKTYDFLIIPGGKAVSETHYQNGWTKAIMDDFMEAGKLIACICAAPSLLGRLGYLTSRDYVCYPGFESLAFQGHYWENKAVVISNHVITSKGAGTTFAFAEAIITFLKGENIAKQTLEKIYYHH